MEVKDGDAAGYDDEVEVTFVLKNVNEVRPCYRVHHFVMVSLLTSAFVWCPGPQAPVLPSNAPVVLSSTAVAGTSFNILRARDQDLGDGSNYRGTLKMAIVGKWLRGALLVTYFYVSHPNRWFS